MTRGRRRATSSSTRSALMAMAAAEPSPAAVMTWARGLAALPATQTPGTLVRPVASATTQPALVDGAAEAGEQVVVGTNCGRTNTAVRGDDPAVVELDAGQAVVLDDEAGDRARRRRRSPRATSCSRCVGGQRRRSCGEEHDVVGPLPDQLRVLDGLGAFRRGRRAAGRGPRSRGSTGSAAGRGPSARARRGCRGARRGARWRPARRRAETRPPSASTTSKRGVPVLGPVRATRPSMSSPP